MIPEGVGAVRAFAKDGAPAEKTNELLVNAGLAVEKLWKQRGYDPRKPEVIKAKLGYALDTYEAAAYLVTGLDGIRAHMQYIQKITFFRDFSRSYVR